VLPLMSSIQDYCRGAEVGLLYLLEFDVLFE
jgi:hypothetical protein